MKKYLAKQNALATLSSVVFVLLLSSIPSASSGSRMDSARITIDTVVKVDGKPTTIVPLGKSYSVNFSADNLDLTGPYSAVWNLYSDGALVWTQKSEPITKSGNYTRKFVKPTFPPGSKKFGPFYLCVSAVNSLGQKSFGAPCSNVLWIGIEVPLQQVSNGCGGQLGSKYIDKWMQKSWDSIKIGSETVVFKPACDVHDAGYSGLTVKNPFMNSIIDYRTLTRKLIDDFFAADLQSICMDHPGVITKCMSYPLKYYEAVRTVGYWFYDADPTVPTAQARYAELKGRTTAPKEVGRTNN